jgi:tetratricopeptide (TPR) repeat protein
MSSNNDPHYQEIGMICAEVAEIVAETGDFEQADMILNALESANIFTAEKATLGRMYMRMLGKKTDLALSYGEKAYSENPLLHKVAYLLGQLYELAEQPQVARTWFEKSLQVHAEADWRPHALEQYARLNAMHQASRRTMDVTSGSLRV